MFDPNAGTTAPIGAAPQFGSVSARMWRPLTGRSFSVSRSYMLGGKQWGQMVAVEFYKMAIGGGVGRLLERRRLVDFADRQEFELWAQTALALRRNDPDVWEWPEAVRVCDAGGHELYVWTLWDQIQAGKPVV